MLSLPPTNLSLSGAIAVTTPRSSHDLRSRLSAFDRFDATLPSACASIPVRVSLPFVAPSKKAQTLHGVTRSVQMAGLDAYSCRSI
jgi:hypothetical protein